MRFSGCTSGAVNVLSNGCDRIQHRINSGSLDSITVTSKSLRTPEKLATTGISRKTLTVFQPIYMFDCTTLPSGLFFEYCCHVREQSVAWRVDRMEILHGAKSHEPTEWLNTSGWFTKVKNTQAQHSYSSGYSSSTECAFAHLPSGRSAPQVFRWN